MKGLDTVDVTLLRSFRAVVAHRSMTRAAKELGYAPSAVSQHVGRLEKLVGVQLLSRSPREPVSPTAAGREVAEMAGNLLAAVSDFAVGCRTVGEGDVELRIAVFQTAAARLLPRAISALQRIDPSARVRMMQAEPASGLPLLTSGAVDLLIANRYMADELPAIPRVQETLLGIERMPLVRPSGFSSQQAVWVAGEPGGSARRLLERWAAANGVTLDVRYEVEDAHTVLSLCAEGLAQGIVPISVLQARSDLDVEREDLLLEGEPVHRSILALTRRRYTHPLTEQLCAELRAELAEVELRDNS